MLGQPPGISRRINPTETAFVKQMKLDVYLNSKCFNQAIIKVYLCEDLLQSGDNSFVLICPPSGNLVLLLRRPAGNSSALAFFHVLLQLFIPLSNCFDCFQTVQLSNVLSEGFFVLLLYLPQPSIVPTITQRCRFYSLTKQLCYRTYSPAPYFSLLNSLIAFMKPLTS